MLNIRIGFALIYLVALIACRKHENLSSSQNSKPNSSEKKETQASFGIISDLNTSYFGHCLERVGDVFERNNGEEECKVVKQKYYHGFCYQNSICRPKQKKAIDPSGAPILNPVANMDYIGGTAHGCQNFRKQCINSCQTLYPEFNASALKCVNLCESARLICQEIGRVTDPNGHFDCDDFVRAYRQIVAEPAGIKNWAFFASTPVGSHAMAIIEQPPVLSPLPAGHCRYCVIEPQMDELLGGETPLIACWSQTCGIPSVPEDLAMQRGWSNMQIMESNEQANGGEADYTQYLGMVDLLNQRLREYYIRMQAKTECKGNPCAKDKTSN